MDDPSAAARTHYPTIADAKFSRIYAVVTSLRVDQLSELKADIPVCAACSYFQTRPFTAFARAE